MTHHNAAEKQELPGRERAAERGTEQQNLRRLEARFSAAIEHLPVGITQADTQGRITLFNTAFCTMLGYAADELVGKRYAEITYPADVQGSAVARQRMLRGEVDHYTIEKRYIKKDGSLLWGRVTAMPSYDVDGVLDGTVGILENITERKAAEAEVDRVQKELVRASHQAGMAEVAASVLHNVGNVLNSLNVSASVLGGHLRGSKVDTLARGVAVLQDNAHHLSTFLSEDERGRHLPDFLTQLSNHLLKNQRASLAELQSLVQNIDHIKGIVAAQQKYAKRCGLTETVAIETLVEDSLAMNRGAFARHGVVLIREFNTVPQITVDKHKVLQILVNLERNAKYACDASDRSDKTVTVRIAACERGVRIEVIDNGVGIAPEHQASLFTHGFTTKKEGHGFGLHSGALAARELGGTLEAASGGLGCGATFTLTLPLTAPG